MSMLHHRHKITLSASSRSLVSGVIVRGRKESWDRLRSGVWISSVGLGILWRWWCMLVDGEFFFSNFCRLWKRDSELYRVACKMNESILQYELIILQHLLMCCVGWSSWSQYSIRRSVSLRHTLVDDWIMAFAIVRLISSPKPTNSFHSNNGTISSVHTPSSYPPSTSTEPSRKTSTSPTSPNHKPHTTEGNSGYWIFFAKHQIRLHYGVLKRVCWRCTIV